MNATTWSAIGTCVAAGASVTLLFYAIRQVGEAKRLRRSQTRPFVVVDTAPDFLIYLTVENIGKTVARNLTFEFPVKPIPVLDPENNDVENAPLFKDGVKVLPPGKRYRVFFDSFNARMENPELPMVYEVIAHYEDDDGYSYHDPFTLDLNSFLHTEPEVAALPKIAAELAAIAKQTQRWSDGANGILVHARDKDQMDERQRLARDARRAARDGS